MKSSKFFTVIAFATLFCCQFQANAQWIQNTTTKNITTNTPFNNLATAKVGIGTATPTGAKLVVKSGTGSETNAIFGQGNAGISLVQNWPGVGFNTYFSGTSWRAMSPGFGAQWICAPSTGTTALAMTNNATATDEVVTQTLPLVIENNGNIAMGGPTTASKLSINAQDGLLIHGYEPFLTLRDDNSNRSAAFQAAHGDIVFHKGVDNGAGVYNYVAQMVIKNDGNVGIGTANPTYKLAVNGTIRAKEIRVETGWADYVFAPEYRLRPLEEVASFIHANKHLPDMQPAAEIAANGLDVAATTTKMMAKIEELTLYLIEMKKENEALKARVETLEGIPTATDRH